MAFVQKYYDMNKNECDEIINQITQFFESKENIRKINELKKQKTLIHLHEEFSDQFSYKFLSSYQVIFFLSIDTIIVIKNYFPIDPKPSDLFMSEMMFHVINENVIVKKIKYRKSIILPNKQIDKKWEKISDRNILNICYELDNEENIEINIFPSSHIYANAKIIIDKNHCLMNINPLLYVYDSFLIGYSTEEKNYVCAQVDHLYKAFQQNNSIITQTLLDYVLTGKSFVFDQEIIDEMKLRHDLNVCSMEEIELFESVIVNNKILNKNR